MQTMADLRIHDVQIDEELNPESVRVRRLQYSIQCAASLGEYLEFLPPLMAVGGVKLILRLLDAWRLHPCQLNDALRMLNALLAHRRYVNSGKYASCTHPGYMHMAFRCFLRPMCACMKGPATLFWAYVDLQD